MTEKPETTAIPFEWRQSASQELLELANSMMRGAKNLTRQAGRILDPEPKNHGLTIGGLRRYGGSIMPCADQMVRIEAILTGTPVDQCRNEQEKKRKKREARERENAETWRRIHDSENPHEEWQRTFPLPLHKALEPHQNGNVIAGPWDNGGSAER